jgi:hypothetical protein
MDAMQTPIVNELSRMSAHVHADLFWGGLRRTQTSRPVRASRRGRTDRGPRRPPLTKVFSGGRS